MFDISITLLDQLVKILPELIVLYILFDFVGSLLFGKR